MREIQLLEPLRQDALHVFQVFRPSSQDLHHDEILWRGNWHRQAFDFDRHGSLDEGVLDARSGKDYVQWQLRGYMQKRQDSRARDKRLGVRHAQMEASLLHGVT